MCLRSILGSERAPDSTRAISQLPFSLGGLGLTSAVRSRVAAHWSSWADCIHMIRQRHPSVAETLITGIHRGPTPCFAPVRTCQGTLEEAGLEIPSWRTLADTPPQREDGAEPAEPKVEWQHRATRCLEDQHLRVQLWPTLTNPVRALMRSQCGPLASAALTALPTNRATRLDPQPFRMWLCPLPLSSRTCRCGRLLDVYGHHRAACSRAGVLGTRGFPLERAAAQICREAGGRVGVDRFVRDLDLVAFNGFDQRRIEVIVDGTLWHGAQLAVDTTLVSPLHGDGSARRNAATTSGVALRDARRAKERTYPELTGEGGRSRLVVLAARSGRVGGPRKLHSSSELWRRPRRKSHPSSYKVESVQRTSDVGALCWRAVL